jgi:uncharacterized protein (DUF488 family)
MSHQQQSEHCFTIGHWNSPIDLFIDTVRSAGIDTIIDVRSSPYSRFNPHFNRENLEKSLRERDMDYRFMGDRLGGRYTDPGLLYPTFDSETYHMIQHRTRTPAEQWGRIGA